MKKFLLPLTIAALTPLMASGIVIKVQIDGICYSKDTSTKMASVTSGVSMWDFYYTGDVVVPETFSNSGTYTVNAVGDEAFYMSTPTSVTLPSTVLTIGKDAFYGVTTLEDMIIPNSVTSIGNNCFMGTGLKSVTIGSGVQEIGANAFASCTSLTDVYIHAETPPSIYGSTFQNKENITLHVPVGKISAYRDNLWDTSWKGFKNYVEIGAAPTADVKVDGVYYRLSYDDETAMVLAAYKLKENGVQVNYSGDVIIPPSVTYDDKEFKVTSLEAECFYRCTPTSISLPETLLTIGLESFWEIKTMESLVIPNSVKTIDRGNFQYFGIKTLTLGSGLESLGIYCFNENTNLTDIYCLAQTPPTLDPNTFCSATEKATWTLHVPYGLADTYRNAPYWDGFKEYVEIPFETLDVKIDGLYYRLYNDGNTAMVRAATKFTENGGPVDYTGDVVVPPTVTYDGKDYTVTALENNCFQNCTPTSISLPETLLTLGTSTFYGITTLDELVIPNSVEKIEIADFWNLGVRSLTLGSGVKNLDYQCFKSNDNLTDLYVLAVVPPTCTYTSFGSPEQKADITLHVPLGTVDAYMQAEFWDGFKAYVEPDPIPVDASIDGFKYQLIDRDLTAVVTGLTEDNAEIEDVVIVPTVQFEGDTYNVVSVGENAFAGTDIRTVVIGENVETIAEGAFSDCTNLYAVILPDNLKLIGTRAFFGSPAIRYMRCVNTTPPSFPSDPSDSNFYGEAFSTEIWPDCMLVIPANMFGNYKKCAGWKNFRSWYYWHDYDVMPTSFAFDTDNLTGVVGNTVNLGFTFVPAETTFKDVMELTIDNPEIATLNKTSLPGGGFAYSLELLKEGTATLTAFCAQFKAQATLTVSPEAGIGEINADCDGQTRYFNLQGIEIAHPVDGQVVISVRGTEITKEVYSK